MNQLTPNRCIGVLIGIFVLGCAVGHVAAVKCFAPVSKLTTVKAIEEAMAESKSQACAKAKCLQYLPPSTGTDRKGKVQVTIQCEDACPATIDAAAIGAGYTCFPDCDTTTLGTSKCKKIADITANTKTCYEYKGKKVADVSKLEKVYCMDKCQYSEFKDGSDAAVFMGCESDCAVFKSANSAADACKECADDSACEGNLKSATGTNPAAPAAAGNATAAAGAAVTTKKPAASGSNRITGSTCLIVPMATLLFAASLEMLQF